MCIRKSKSTKSKKNRRDQGTSAEDEIICFFPMGLISRDDRITERGGLARKRGGWETTAYITWTEGCSGARSEKYRKKKKRGGRGGREKREGTSGRKLGETLDKNK